MSMRFHRPVAAALAAGVLTACDTPATDPAIPTPSLGVVVAPPLTLEWQQEARTLVIERGMSPLAASRMFAAASMAAMRAVESADASSDASENGRRGPGYGPGGRDRYEIRRGAVAGASAQVLAWFVPAAAGDLEAMVAAQGESGRGDVHPHFTAGVEIGRAAGDAVIEHVTTDGFTTPWTGSIPVGEGLWTTTTLPPAGATLGDVTPWFVTSDEQFWPPPPPEFGSTAFNDDLAAVAAVSASLTQEQRDIALGWAYGGGTYTPVGYWNELASTYAAADGLHEAEAAELFGLMGAAVFDALITTFGAKYHYWLLRPHQADASIVPVFPVPNYPAYPSGHASVSAASARVLAHFFPNRTAELNAKVEEAALSRIYAGIHYFFDMTAGRASAEAVADWVIQTAQP